MELAKENGEVFSDADPPHTGIAMFNMVLLEFIQDWNVENKLFSVILYYTTNDFSFSTADRGDPAWVRYCFSVFVYNALTLYIASYGSSILRVHSTD